VVAEVTIIGERRLLAERALRTPWSVGVPIT